MGCVVSSTSSASEPPLVRSAAEQSEQQQQQESTRRSSVDCWPPSTPKSASMQSTEIGELDQDAARSKSSASDSVPFHLPRVPSFGASQWESGQVSSSKTEGSSEWSPVDPNPTSSFALPTWISGPAPSAMTQSGKLPKAPSVSAFSLQSASTSISDRAGSPRHLAAVPAVDQASPNEVPFSSNSIFVPKEPSISHEIRKRYQGGYVDPATNVRFLTSVQRHEILCLEIEGKRHPPSGTGLLFTHPSIHHGTPFPLRAFADTMAWTKDLKGLDRITCCEFLADLHRYLTMADSNPLSTHHSDIINQAMTRAQMFGLVKLQVILLELFTQMADLHVLASSPSRFLAALKDEDYAELQKAYSEQLYAVTAKQPSGARSIHGQCLATFVKCRILQNIHYCVLLGNFVATSIVANLEAERARKREAARGRISTC